MFFDLNSVNLTTNEKAEEIVSRLVIFLKLANRRGKRCWPWQQHFQSLRYTVGWLLNLTWQKTGKTWNREGWGIKDEGESEGWESKGGGGGGGLIDEGLGVRGEEWWLRGYGQVLWWEGRGMRNEGWGLRVEGWRLKNKGWGVLDDGL